MGAGAGKPVGPQGQQSQGGINGVIQQAMQNSQPQAPSMLQAVSNVWRDKGLLGPNAPQRGIGALPGMVHGMWERKGFVDNHEPMPMGNLQGGPLPPPMDQSQAMQGAAMGAPQMPPPGGMLPGYMQAFNQFQPHAPSADPIGFINSAGQYSGMGMPHPMGASDNWTPPTGTPNSPVHASGAALTPSELEQYNMQQQQLQPQMPPPQMPQAPYTQQTRMEDQRMMAMRRMQRMRGM